MSKQIDIKRITEAVPAVSDTWHNFRREVDHLFDRFSNGFDSLALEPFSRMQRLFDQDNAGFAALAVDVSEAENAYAITMELPGVDEKNVDVSVDRDMLVIKGEKRREKEEISKTRHLSERSYGSFRRVFGLPRGTDAAKIEARFTNGVLTLTIPKALVNQNVQRVDVKAA